MGNRIFCWVGLIILIGCFQMVRAQDYNPVFRSYNNSEGLSQSVVMTIFQDSKNFLWFGTEDGLNKFDGYNFKIYRYDPDDSSSISDNWVNRVWLEDNDGCLWINTADNIINVFSPKYESFRKIVPQKVKSNLLPFRIVWFIFQDKTGKIWISTNTGLFVMDKKTWTFKHVFVNQEDVKPRHFIRYYEDLNQNIWFSSDEGLLIWNNSASKIVKDYTRSNNGLAGFIAGVSGDNHGNTFVVNLANEVFRFANNPTNYKVFSLQHQPSEKPEKKNFRVKSDDVPAWMNMDKNYNLWILTSGGLIKFDTKTNGFTEYKSSLDKTTLSSNNLTSFYEDRSGNLWFGTDNGLNKYIPGTNSFIRYHQKKEGTANHGVSKIFEDKTGRIWTLDLPQPEASNLSYLNEKTGALVHVDKSHRGNEMIQLQMLYSPFFDRQGNMWLGSYGSGVVEYAPYQKRFDLIKNLSGNKNSILGNSSWSITEDCKGRLWLALFQDGLDCYDPRTGNVVHYQDKLAKVLGNTGFTVLSTVMDNYNKLWIGIQGFGVVSLDVNSGNMVLYNDKPGNKHFITSVAMYALTRDLKGNVLISYANKGLDILNPQTGEIKNYQKGSNSAACLISNTVRYAIQSSDGKYWISQDGAISILDPLTGKMTHYLSRKKGGKGILVDKAGCIFEDSQKKIWIGTHGGGLALYDPVNKEFKYWDEKKGLINNVIYCILEDESHKLWLSTNNGISSFDPSSSRFTNYYANDGLQGSEFNANAACHTRDGKIYFGGINGITAFYPKNIVVDQVPPQVSLTGLQIYNKKVEVLPYSLRKEATEDAVKKVVKCGEHLYLENDISYTTALELDYDYKVFTFEFSALKFDMPERCTFMYKMEGFEKEWNLAGHRRYASYTNLPPGEYIFKVTAANADGIWNPEPARIKIIIKPPFYLTWWFISLGIGLLILGTYSFIMQREKHLKNTKMILEQNVKQRTQELNAKNEELTLRNIQIIKQKEEIANQARRLKVDMDTLHQASELALLRTQVNPHFLFNTLNNIYSLVYQKSSEAPEALMKLSDIMRYMLYETSSDKVLLEKEIKYLQSFIDLQMLRLKSKNFVQLDITGDPSGKIIAPMLLIPFVENAFKHGDKTVPSPGILIKMDCKPGGMGFMVSNTKRNGGAKDCIGGIGLPNVQRRLELIYHGKYSLDILDGENKFEINLVINEL